MTMKPIEIALASENSYFCGLLVTAASIAHFADPNKHLRFTIMDNGIADDNFSVLENIVTSQHTLSSIRRIKLTDQDLSNFPNWHGNKAAYARLMLPHLLSKDIAHIIYCDVDFLWMADITKLWEMRSANVPFISTKDLNPIIKQREADWYSGLNLDVDMSNYFCSGLSFFNLSMFREQNLATKTIDFVLEHPDVGSADQTALNAILNGRHQIVDQCWQRFSRDSPIETLVAPMALHYAGDVPWKISKRSHMLTDVQLLWFRFNASIRGISLWQSLRLHYSALEIILNRLIFKTVIGIPILRWMFDFTLSKTGRWGFYEKMTRQQFKLLMHLLTFKNA